MTIWLGPYDIVQVKNNLGIASTEFLACFAKSHDSVKDRYPIITMKLTEDGRCPFSADEGCRVYADRPWVCRMFPLVPPMIEDERPAPVVDVAAPLFRLNGDHCKGLRQGARLTIGEWRERQGVLPYEAMNAEWKKVTHHRDFEKKDFLRGPESARFRLCYDVDAFKETAWRTASREFEIEQELAGRIEADDRELLKFIFLWLRHTLYGEKTKIRSPM